MTPPRRRRPADAADAIAIVGAACRLPGAPDLEAYWRLLAEGRDTVTTVPADRFAQARFLYPRHGEPGRSYTFAAGTIGDAAFLFDAAAFGLSPRGGRAAAAAACGAWRGGGGGGVPHAPGLGAHRQNRRDAAATDTAADGMWRPVGEGTWFVLGGAQDFGLEAAKWLAARSVTRLALIGRRGPATPGAQAAVRTLAALGARASLHACDATDSAALARVLAQVRAAHPPIRGVLHAAAVFDDGAASALDAARFRGVLAAKLTVAETLDRLTAGDPLETFVLFSSATTAFGNPGQANYVAANAALEALARRRRAQGQPAVAIAWGPIADVGVLSADADTAETLRRRFGVEPMPAAEALEALHHALRPDAPPVLFLARIAWAQARAALPVLAEPAFAAAVRAAAGEPAGDLRERLRGLPPAEARALLRGLVAEEAARILRLPPEAVPTDASVAGFGLDSLGGLELRMALERRIGTQVPLAAVTEDLTLAMLAERIAGVVLEDCTDAMVATLMEAYEPTTVPATPAEAAE